MKVYESTAYNAMVPETFSWHKCHDSWARNLAECFVWEARNAKSELLREQWRNALAYLAGVATTKDESLVGGFTGSTQVPGRKSDLETGRS